MPQIIFLPHAEHCPEGAVVEAVAGETVLDAALRHGIDRAAPDGSGNPAKQTSFFHHVLSYR